MYVSRGLKQANVVGYLEWLATYARDAVWKKHKEARNKVLEKKGSDRTTMPQPLWRDSHIDETQNFRITNFRSVNDSGSIEVGQRTALVGRNESGKTNLLLALASLNPPDGLPEITFVKDFPRDDSLSSEDRAII